MKNILIVSGHTNITGSTANKTIIEAVQVAYPEVEVSYLDKLYPDYKIDVAAEQDKLKKADIIIFEYPVYWYHLPSLMEKWMEDVFQYGFAYGSTGTALEGKKLIGSFTMGGIEEAYVKVDGVGFDVEDLLAPLKAIAGFTKMNFVGHVHTAGAMAHGDAGVEGVKALAVDHGKRLVDLIERN